MVLWLRACSLLQSVSKRDICPKISKQGSRRRIRKKHTAINSSHAHRLKFTGKVLKQEVALLKVLKLDAKGNTEELKVSTNL